VTVHFLNRGTKYHIGDNSYGGSVDKEFIDAYPVVGLAWAQPFTVSHDDVIEIVIEDLWGVDYGKNNVVYVNDVKIGEIGGEHNRKTWSSPEAYRVRGGETYLIKIASLGPGDPDDFVFQGVIVKTSGSAEVTSEGCPKILRNVSDDYWQSDYDTGQRAPSAGVERAVSQGIGQAYVRSSEFPGDDIREYWDRDFYITFLTFTGDSWVVVLTQGGPYTKQAWLTRSEFPSEKIDKYWDDDYEITQLTSAREKFALVVSGPRIGTGQFYATDKEFPKKTIKKQWKKDYNIQSLEYCYKG
jgi:hypothetical protein